MKILVTGFEPFGGDIINPSAEAVRLLPDEIAGAKIIRLELPVEAVGSERVLKEAVLRECPDVILSVGQAAGRTDISVERVAINIDDFGIEDNKGYQPVDVKIIEQAPDAYLTDLPIKATVMAIKAHGIPASVSNSAGTFVCNHVMFLGLHLSKNSDKKMRAGFIHVPLLPEQAAKKTAARASMPLDLIVKGLTVAVETIVKVEKDVAFVGGKIC